MKSTIASPDYLWLALPHEDTETGLVVPSLLARRRCGGLDAADLSDLRDPALPLSRPARAADCPRSAALPPDRHDPRGRRNARRGRLVLANGAPQVAPLLLHTLRGERRRGRRALAGEHLRTDVPPRWKARHYRGRRVETGRRRNGDRREGKRSRARLPHPQHVLSP